MLRIKLTDPDDQKRLDFPEDGLLLDEQRLTNKEAILIQKAIGLNPDEMAAALRGGSVEALSSLVFLALRRNGSTLTWDEMEFSLGGVKLEDVDDGEPTPGKASPAASSTLVSG